MKAALIPTVLLALTSGCLGVSPEQARAREIGRGEDDDDGDPEHNPGLPCLACHGRDYSPGDDVFALAGTVFLRASDRDDEGIGEVTVHVRDARGRDFAAVSNRAGNFMFSVDEGEDARVRMRDDGETELGFWPEYPLEVWIESGGTEQRMRGLIRREGSCATCHDGAPSATSVGRVWLAEGP